MACWVSELASWLCHRIGAHHPSLDTAATKLTLPSSHKHAYTFKTEALDSASSTLNRSAGFDDTLGCLSFDKAGIWGGGRADQANGRRRLPPNVTVQHWTASNQLGDGVSVTVNTSA